MKQAAIHKAFEDFLQRKSLKLTSQRDRIFNKAYATHEHFTAEMLFNWLREDDSGPRVSRATVYRTLALLVEGEFLDSLDTGQGELYYEHVLGHKHHDHMVCIDCGRIEEFFEEEIERLQHEACERKGFTLVSHDLRLMGYCRVCSRKREASTGPAKSSAGNA